MTEPTLQLIDVPGEQGRTTVTLVASLAARLAALAATSGSDAVGSMTAGHAALGRAVAATADGARMLAAIRASRAGANGESLWRALGMDQWAGSLPPTAVLDQFMGDVALLAALDLEQVLELPLAPSEIYGPADAPQPEPVEFAEYLLGMWAFGRAVASAVEMLVGDGVSGQPDVVGVRCAHQRPPGRPPAPVITTDTLRPPAPLDPTAGAYKDWLHLNMFDFRTECVGLINASIHGSPTDPGCQVVITALASTAGGWVGNVVSRPWAQATVTLDRIATPAGAVALAGDDRVLASASVDGLRLGLTATPQSLPYLVAGPAPFGSGWIGWRVVPRLVVDGTVDDERGSPGVGRTVAGAPASPLSLRAVGYHDHNWGRWHWGDDIGWEWGSFVTPVGSSIVVARTTDRSHRKPGPLTLVIDHAGARRRFGGPRVRATWSGVGPVPARRLPGAAAALHADRRRPALPAVLTVRARTGDDIVDLEFRCRSIVQLILGDPVTGGWSFLHEMSGSFRANGSIAGSAFEIDGLAMVERLE